MRFIGLSMFSFYNNPDGQLSGQDVVQNSKVSGGLVGYTISQILNIRGWNPYNPNLIYMDTFFSSLCAGDSADTANKKAIDATSIVFDKKSYIMWEEMTLNGDPTYTIP